MAFHLPAFVAAELDRAFTERHGAGCLGRVQLRHAQPFRSIVRRVTRELNTLTPTFSKQRKPMVRTFGLSADNTVSSVRAGNVPIGRGGFCARQGTNRAANAAASPSKNDRRFILPLGFLVSSPWRIQKALPRGSMAASVPRASGASLDAAASGGSRWRSATDNCRVRSCRCRRCDRVPYLEGAGPCRLEIAQSPRCLPFGVFATASRC